MTLTDALEHVVVQLKYTNAHLGAITHELGRIACPVEDKPETTDPKQLNINWGDSPKEE